MQETFEAFWDSLPGNEQTKNLDNKKHQSGVFLYEDITEYF